MRWGKVWVLQSPSKVSRQDWSVGQHNPREGLYQAFPVVMALASSGMSEQLQGCTFILYGHVVPYLDVCTTSGKTLIRFIFTQILNRVKNNNNKKQPAHFVKSTKVETFILRLRSLLLPALLTGEWGWIKSSRVIAGINLYNAMFFF